MRVKVIVNPAAGKDEPVLNVLNDVFDPAGIEWDVAITHGGGDAEAEAAGAAADGYDLVGAYGGDGTAAEVASGLAGGGVPMLLLPGGTGNALAEELGIPAGLAAAAALAVPGNGEVRRVDLGRSLDRVFVLRMTAGFEASVVADTTREAKDRFGGLAYILSALQAIPEASIATYSMTIDGADVACEGLAAIVANSVASGVAGVRFADDVSVSDGLLDVFVVQRADLPMLLASAGDLAKGDRPRILSRWRGREIRLQATPVQPVLADGEDAGTTPLEVRVEPGALMVLVPKSTAGAAGQVADGATASGPAAR